MIVDLPDSSTAAVSKKLISLRESGGAVTIGRVLTLIVSAEEGEPTETAIEAANDASREHPCRVIVIARGSRSERSRLDGQIRVGGDAGASEVVVLRLYGPLADHADSVVVPFLLPDTPVVAWWPGRAPAVPADDGLGRLASRRITDAGKSVAAGEGSRSALTARRDGYRPGDSDLCWSRITPWRALLASALDQPPHGPITAARVSGPAGNPEIDLLAGWLRAQLGVPVQRLVGSFEVRLSRGERTLTLAVDQNNTAVISRPGQPDGRVAIARRDISDCVAEELRRLEDDVIYQLALAGVPEVEEAAS
ncbi:glucose-6-phosphate dehydrogenase assembly protein OpcA [Tsukamurella sp. 8F]|uniref:glucose-6-phosphate dehydrogenase assembly protein OpcA n=1 Tax=unclassified Tsukamurella TaxID=2633480 RepID=UPI0023B8C1BB|nr:MULTISPECIES: glucose-6-phosphate dehydrogenase assembly protein OpcA [unclassified Tsukamurella]MDF0528559.1 glucose-6-phosphate dehydrogenase assembly protein OpcA [Tsukamurella sp. 8J]MDF0585521.1 glucose-6-phosphate dehydrogenase assembly protein OpcA [Tsukamurella sp. 8F]